MDVTLPFRKVGEGSGHAHSRAALQQGSFEGLTCPVSSGMQRLWYSFRGPVFDQAARPIEF